MLGFIIFLSTNNSKDQVSGWYFIENICKDANMSNALTAIEIRHRASTMFASTDASEPEREVFYEHMGHSESIKNKK